MTDNSFNQNESEKQEAAKTFLRKLVEWADFSAGEGLCKIGGETKAHLHPDLFICDFIESVTIDGDELSSIYNVDALHFKLLNILRQALHTEGT